MKRFNDNSQDSFTPEFQISRSDAQEFKSIHSLKDFIQSPHVIKMAIYLYIISLIILMKGKTYVYKTEKLSQVTLESLDYLKSIFDVVIIEVIKN